MLLYGFKGILLKGFNISMKEKISEEQASEILKALDEAIDTGPWEESNFLRVIGKNLHEIRDKFVALVQQAGESGDARASDLANRIALRSGQQEIFIALYSSKGSQLQSWTHILANLPKQMVSRPIYAHEKDVKSFIKSKSNPVNEAYVSMYINQNDVLTQPPEKIPVDKLGKPLLTLKDNSLKLENINRFVHASGVYQYSSGRLIKST